MLILVYQLPMWLKNYFWEVDFCRKFLNRVLEYTYKKLNLLLINSIILVFSSIDMQRRFIQTKLYHKFFLLCLKKSLSQTFESSSCKTLPPKCQCFWCSLLLWIFFIPCYNCKAIFFIQIFCYPEVFITVVLLGSLK